MNKSYCKPMSYIKKMAKKIGQIKKMRPEWDIFKIVEVTQRIIQVGDSESEIQNFKKFNDKKKCKENKGEAR